MDGCLNAAAPVSITYTWKVDTIAPVITTSDSSQYLGCNPIVVAPSFSGLDNCDGIFNPTVTSAGASNIGCMWSQTWTADYTDGCFNAAAPVSITYTWKVDTIAPVISTTCLLYTSDAADE